MRCGPLLNALAAMAAMHGRHSGRCQCTGMLLGPMMQRTRYTDGLRGCLLVLLVGLVVFAVGCWLIWEPVRECWEGPNAAE